jgi:hypothetical protein
MGINYGLSYLEGSVSSKTANGVEVKVVNEIYCNGKVFDGRVTPGTLEPETYMLSASIVDGTIIELKAYEVTKEYTYINLKLVDLNDIYPLKELRNSMCEKYKTCNTVPYDFVISLITHISGFVKSLISRVIGNLRKLVNNLRKIIRVIKYRVGSVQLVRKVYPTTVIYKNVLRGFIECKTLNGVTVTVVNRIYRDGEVLKGDVNHRIIEDDLNEDGSLKTNAILIKATSIDGEIVSFLVYEISTDGKSLRLEDYNLYESNIIDGLLIAMDDVRNVCHTYNNVGDEYTIIYDEL